MKFNQSKIEDMIDEYTKNRKRLDDVFYKLIDGLKDINDREEREKKKLKDTTLIIHDLKHYDNKEVSIICNFVEFAEPLQYQPYKWSHSCLLKDHSGTVKGIFWKKQKSGKYPQDRSFKVTGIVQIYEQFGILLIIKDVYEEVNTILERFD